MTDFCNIDNVIKYNIDPELTKTDRISRVFKLLSTVAIVITVIVMGYFGLVLAICLVLLDFFKYLGGNGIRPGDIFSSIGIEMFITAIGFSLSFVFYNIHHRLSEKCVEHYLENYDRLNSELEKHINATEITEKEK